VIFLSIDQRVKCRENTDVTFKFLLCLMKDKSYTRRWQSWVYLKWH